MRHAAADTLDGRVFMKPCHLAIYIYDGYILFAHNSLEGRVQLRKPYGPAWNPGSLFHFSDSIGFVYMNVLPVVMYIIIIIMPTCVALINLTAMHHMQELSLACMHIYIYICMHAGSID